MEDSRIQVQEKQSSPEEKDLASTGIATYGDWGTAVTGEISIRGWYGIICLEFSQSVRGV